MAFSSVAAVPHSQLPGLTVPDLIALTRIGSTLFGGDEHVVSPDGVHTAVIVQTGDLEQNTREFSLLIFDTPGQRTPPPPHVLARFTTHSNRPAIAQLTWWSNTVLAFLAESADVPAQVYTVDLRTHELTARTHAPQAVTLFSASRAGETLLYVTEAPAPDTSGFAALRARGFVVPPEVSVSDVIAGKWERIAAPNAAQGVLHVVRGGTETAIELPRVAEYGPCPVSDGLSVAPSGERALLLCGPPETIPARWGEYTNETLRGKLAYGTQFPWWVVLDLRTGRTRALTGGPSVSARSAPLWTPDSRAVLLVQDYLPLEGVTLAEWSARAAAPLTAEVDVETGQARIVAAPAQVPVPVRSPLEIEEGPTEPWKLMAVDPRSHQHRVVYDPNPTLTRTHRLARVTVLNWTVKSGAVMSAGVYWPLDFKPGERYPLVIQTHGFKSNKFAPDGYSTTGFAAQPLAAAGIMVVQAFQCTAACGSPEERAREEGPQFQDALEKLIEKLDAMGVIDRSKVALQGYSRSCYHILYFMTHSPDPIAAMSCTDGYDASYVQYLLVVPGMPVRANDFHSRNGGTPFGPTLQHWLMRAPDFNLDRIHAPVQLTALTDGLSLLGEWEPFAALRAQGKPVELKYLPEADHNIVRPWERFASQQNAVDWYRFWLQGYERTEPVTAAGESAQSLADQYARWHHLQGATPTLQSSR